MEDGSIWIGVLASILTALVGYFIGTKRVSRKFETSQTHTHQLDIELAKQVELKETANRISSELKSELEKEREKRSEAEQYLAALKEKLISAEQRISDWEKTREQHLDATKAALLKAGTEMSNKLLDDHKREAKIAKEESEKVVRQTTEQLHQQFQNVFETMKSLNDQVQQSKDTVGVMRQALLNPGGAGALAEITLSNIFKNSGLIEGQDYDMQVFIKDEENSAKPDAIVYLPQDTFLAVDAKASKFFLEIGEAKSDEEVQRLEGKLKQSMQQHLKDLAKREYLNKVERLQKVGSEGHVMIYMFLQTEEALAKLRRIDPGFEQAAWKQKILPVGPTGLINALLQSKLLIANVRQDKNFQTIILEVKALLTSVAKLHECADKIGKSIHASARKYDDFAKSFNSNFLSKVKKIGVLGLAPSKDGSLEKLERYQMVEVGNLIEGEIEEDSDSNIKRLEITSS